jgi:hypothetical protein
MLPPVFCCILSLEPSPENGWPLASPEPFSASQNVRDQKLAAGMLDPKPFQGFGSRSTSNVPSRGAAGIRCDNEV